MCEEENVERKMLYALKSEGKVTLPWGLGRGFSVNFVCSKTSPGQPIVPGLEAEARVREELC